MDTQAVVPTAVVFSDKLLRRFLTVVILSMTTLAVAVAGAALFASFEAISEYAERSGGIDPHYAFLVPLFVDAFIVIAWGADLWLSITGAAKNAQTKQEKAVAYMPKALLALAAVGSFSLNIAHAPRHVGAIGVAVLPPIALVLSSEILMMIVRRAAAARVQRLSAPPLQTQPPTPALSTPALSTPRAVSAPQAPLDSGHRVLTLVEPSEGDARVVIREIVMSENGTRVTAKKAAELAGCSRGRAGVLLKEERERKGAGQ